MKLNVVQGLRLDESNTPKGLITGAVYIEGDVIEVTEREAQILLTTFPDNFANHAH